MAARRGNPGAGGAAAGASETVQLSHLNNPKSTTTNIGTQRSVYAGLRRLGRIVRTRDGWLVYAANGGVLGAYFDVEEARIALREVHR